MKKKTIYVCDFCGKEYDTENDAKVCEATHRFYAEEIFDNIIAFQKRHPELRVGQILVSAANKAGYCGDLFYCPDQILVDGCQLLVNGKERNYA